MHLVAEDVLAMYWVVLPHATLGQQQLQTKAKQVYPHSEPTLGALCCGISWRQAQQQQTKSLGYFMVMNSKYFMLHPLAAATL